MDDKQTKRSKEPNYILIALAVVALFVWAGFAIIGGEKKREHNYSLSAQSYRFYAAAEQEEPADTPSLGDRNALRSAKNYLSVMPFSRDGLIKQLEYEGYTHSQAVYAADNCGADWFEQAVKDAKIYLDTMAFSRSGLIKQLEYEGYTHEQAVFGAEKNGY